MLALFDMTPYKKLRERTFSELKHFFSFSLELIKTEIKEFFLLYIRMQRINFAKNFFNFLAYENHNKKGI